MFTHPRANLIEDRLIGRIDAALRQRPPKTAPTYPRSPAVCWFSSGTVTEEMIEHAEAISATWRAKIRRAR